MALTLLGSVTTWAQEDPVWPEITMILIDTGGNSSPLSTVTDIQAPPPAADPRDEAIFIAIKNGRLYRLPLASAFGAPTEVLDVSGGNFDTASEGGLLGIAFSPDFWTTGIFYVHYSQDNNPDRFSRISRFTMNLETYEANSLEVIILEIPQVRNNHQGGQIAFGPDGYLYLAIGDSGGGNDPDDHAQNPMRLTGKMLRIDVMGTPEPGMAYAIPADNPFVGNATVADEVWAGGLRNPWRFSFDLDTGEMYIADVGQNAQEEIDVVPLAPAGYNFGWRHFEGTRTNLTGGLPLMAGPLTDPAYVYLHDDIGGRGSVTGGYVYRGFAYTRMRGVYVYADYVQDIIWGLQRDSEDNWVNQTLVPPNTISGGRGYTSFGQDNFGNIYAGTDSGDLFHLADLDAGKAQVLEVMRSGDELTLLVAAVPGTAFQIESGASPLGPFTPVGSTLTATRGIASYTLTLTGGATDDEFFQAVRPESLP